MKNIHLLPTKNYKQDYTLQNGEVVEVVKLGQLILNEETGELLVNKSTQWAASCDTDVLVPHHIYITSDEEIKEGDHIVQTNFEKTNTQVIKCETEFQTKIANSKDGSFSKNKIILTTDPDLIKDGVQSIDDEFLEWFIQNPSCESVEVEKIKDSTDRAWYNTVLCRKIYKIIIPKEESKQIKCYCGHTTMCDCGPLEVSDEAKQRAANYMSLKGALEPKQETTLEEAAQKYKDLKLPDDLYDGFIAGAEWQAERMYNEDDMRECWKKAYEESFNKWIKNKPTTIFKKWFEQFKKK